MASLNLCLGLQFKKSLVKKLINENEIDVLFMQETEIKNNSNHNELSINGYNSINRKTHSIMKIFKI